MRRKRSEMIAETRAKLIAVARQTFFEKGYAAASMDDMTTSANLTRGALYHHFGDKKGLLCAVIDEIDKEIDVDLLKITSQINDPWQLLLIESFQYLEKMLDPEIQRIVMRDGPAVLGDMSIWPSQNKYIVLMQMQLQKMMEDDIIYKCDPESLARQINGALLNSASWIANSQNPQITLEKAKNTFKLLLDGIAKK